MKKKDYNHVKIISILCILIVAINIVSLTFAYFTDKAVAEDIIFTTGTVDIDAKVLENDEPSDSFVFTSANVMTWETINRTIRLKTASKDAEACVVRMSVNFYLTWESAPNIPDWENVTEKNYLTLTTNDADWVADSNQKYYYYKYAFSGANPAFDTDISMYITENFSKEGLINYLTKDCGIDLANVDGILSGLKYKIILTVEALQFANMGYEAWTTAPASWAPTLKA